MEGSSSEAVSFISHTRSMSTKQYFAGDQAMILMTSSMHGHREELAHACCKSQVVDKINVQTKAAKLIYPNSEQNVAESRP